MRRKVGILILLVLAVFAAYANVYHNQFLFDDEFLLQKNILIRSWSHWTTMFHVSSTAGAGGLDDFYRPLQTFCYLVVYQLAGLQTEAFHLLNIFLHALNAGLVFALGLALGLPDLYAGSAALLWALHPAHTEAVTYMSATADPLHVFFLLLSCWLILKFDRPLARWGACLTGALALMSKESAAVLPLLIMVCLYFKRRTLLAALKESWPFWILLAGYLTLRATVLNFRNSFDLYPAANVYTEHVWVRVATFFATLPSYLGILIFPRGLHMDRAFPAYISFFSWAVLGGAVIFLSLAMALVRGLKSEHRWWVFMPAWILAAMAPQSGVLIPVNALLLEHWLYLPTIAIFLSLFYALSRWNQPRVVFTATLLLALICGTLTFRQNRVWADPITFYTNILRYEKGSLRVHNNLAMAYSDSGQLNLAEKEYLKAIELDPKSPNPHHNLGLLYLREGQIEPGRESLEKALAADPQFYYSLPYLAQIYGQSGDVQRAKAYLQRYQEIRSHLQIHP